MAFRKNVSRAAVSLLLIAVVLSCLTGALAAEAGYEDESGAKYLKSDLPEHIDVDIINFKARLNEMGFYKAGAREEVLQSKELDDLTMAAVKEVCDLNPEFTYHDDGVSNALFWRVMGDTEGPLVTPLDQQNTTIEPGSEGEAVTRVQNVLNQLGYDAVGTFEPGVYDDVLQKAVDAFVRCNKLVYEEGSGITTELQQVLFGDDPKPYEADVGLVERVKGYVTGSTDMFGFAVPNIAILLVGLLFVIVIIVLVIKLTAPSGGRKAGDDADTIKFTVEYGGDSFVHHVEKGSPVRIGRGVGDFPLRADDKSVSREHCEIVPENGGLILVDTSSFGTKVNGKLCHHDSVPLRSGDTIEIGKHRITVQF